MPRGIEHHQDGKEYRCYDLGEYKTVAHVFVIYDGYNRNMALLHARISELESISRDLKLKLYIEEEKNRFMKADLMELNRNNKLKIIIPVGLAVIEAAALSVLSVYQVVTR